VSSNRSSRLTAIRPISGSGWRIVVSAGVTNRGFLEIVEADDREIFRDANGARARGLHARSAMLSLNEKIAVGGSGRPQQLLRRRDTTRDLEIPFDLELRVGYEPCRRERGVVAAPAVLGRLHPAGTGDCAMRVCPSDNRCFIAWSGTCCMGGRDGGYAFVQRHHRVDHDESVAVVQQCLELVAPTPRGG